MLPDSGNRAQVLDAKQTRPSPVLRGCGYARLGCPPITDLNWTLFKSRHPGLFLINARLPGDHEFNLGPTASCRGESLAEGVEGLGVGLA